MYTWYFTDVQYSFTDSKDVLNSLICVVYFSKHFNSVFHKKNYETYWRSSIIACHEKTRDWILRIFTFNDKNPLYLRIILTPQFFFEGQSNQGVTQLGIKPFDISQVSRIVILSWKNARFFQTLIYFSVSSLDNTSHKFWDQSPSPHYQCCLQVSVVVSWHKLRCCYSANMLQLWVGGRGLMFFCKVDHSRISIHFSRNWLGLNNLCEIL